MSTKPNQFAKALGRSLRLARIQAGYSQQDMVMLMEDRIKQQTISGWERGHLPSLHFLIDYCVILNKPVSKVFAVAEYIIKEWKENCNV